VLRVELLVTDDRLMFACADVLSGVLGTWSRKLGGRDIDLQVPAPSHVLSLCYTSTHARPIYRARLWAPLLAASLLAKPALHLSLVASHLRLRCSLVCDHTVPRPRARGRSSSSSTSSASAPRCTVVSASLKAVAGLFRTIVATTRNHRRTCPPSLLRPAPTPSLG
jgi:hypothetical protein